MLAETLAPAAEENTDFAHVAQPTAPTSGEDEFTAALAQYEAAETHWQEACAESRAARAMIEERAPFPAALMVSGNRYPTATIIKKSGDLTFDQKASMVAAFEEWHPRHEAAVAAAQASHNGWGSNEDEDERSDAILDIRDDAIEAVIEATPPDLDALLLQFKLSLHLHDATWASDDVDGPLFYSRLLDSSFHDGARGKLQLYRAALRLAGKHDHPALTAEPWYPAPWVEAFERNPGYEVHSRGVCFLQPAGDNSPPAAEGRPLWDALAPWQKERVKDFADERQQSGFVSWVSRYEGAGGSFALVDGEILFGRSSLNEDKNQNPAIDALLTELKAAPALAAGVRKMIRGRLQ